MKKSLLALLKREGLAESLCCGRPRSGSKVAMFYIQINLTKEGVKKVYHVIDRCFQALAGLRQKGIPRYIFDDFQKIQTLQYQYPSREKPFNEVFQHVVHIKDADLSTYPERKFVIQKYDPEAVQALLDHMIPSTCRYNLAASPKETNVPPTKKEQWMGIEYAIKPIPESVLKGWEQAQPNPNIQLPPPNPYVPRQLTLLSPHQDRSNRSFSFPKPNVLEDNDTGKLYYFPDLQYAMPMVSWTVRIKTPEVDFQEASKIVLADLYVKSLEEALTPSTYAATAAGLNYEITREEDGIQIVINGFSDKAAVLLETIGKALKTSPPPPEQFKIYKNALLRQYQNFTHESPTKIGLEVLKEVLYKDYVTEKEKAKAIRKVTLSSFGDYLSSLYSKAYIEGIFYGNTTEKQALDSWNQLKVVLKSSPYPKADQKPIQVMTLSAEGPFYMQKKVKVLGNAIILAIEQVPFSFKDYAIQDILSQAIKDPFFYELRTQQQTGYLVYQTLEEVRKHLFSLFLIQSHSHDPRDVLARMELMIESYGRELHTNLTESSFNTIKQALIHELEHPPENIKKMGEELSKIAFEHQGDFKWNAQRAEGIRAVSYADFIKSAQDFLGKQQKRRLAILIQGVVAKEEGIHYTAARSVEWLHKQIESK